MNIEKLIQNEFMMIMDSNNLDRLDKYVNIHGVNREINGATLLFWAVYRNKLRIVNRLLLLGADPNFRNQTGTSCLSLACYFGFVEVVKTLTKHGAKIDASCVNRAYCVWQNKSAELCKGKMQSPALNFCA